jgi:hypothetical protein
MASRSGKDPDDSFDKWIKEAKLPAAASLQDLLACIASGKKQDGGVFSRGNQIEAYAELANHSSECLVSYQRHRPFCASRMLAKANHNNPKNLKSS